MAHIVLPGNEIPLILDFDEIGIRDFLSHVLVMK